MVATSTMMAIVLNLVLGLAIPAVLYFMVKKKFGQNRIAFFTGCGIMLLFAFILESFVHSAVLGGSLGNTIMGNIWLYALYGGAMAAIFEETGRFAAFRFILKKYRENDGTALLYGAGHGGFEAFYILFFSGVNNLFFASMINSGNTELLTSGLSGAALAQIEGTIQQMLEISWGVFLLSPIERIAAIILQLSFSVLVWFAVKKKKYGFFGLSLLLHFFVDAVTVVVNQMLSGLGNMGVVFTEAVVWLMALTAAALARKVWREQKAEAGERTFES